MTGQITTAMHDGEDRNLLRLDRVDDIDSAVALYDQFTDAVGIGLRHSPSHLGMIFQLLGSFSAASNIRPMNLCA